MRVDFFNLQRQLVEIRADIEQAMGSVLDGCQFALGPAVKAFEESFAGFCGAEFAVAVNSGTSALHLALLSAGVGPGDEVITTPNTFIATTEAITMCGARPVFADIDPATRNMDVEAVERVLTVRTKALVPVHLYGTPCPMNEVMELASAKHLHVIEDACQAHGAECLTSWQGGAKSASAWRKAGSIGHAGCFSFYPAKNLGALGEGGILVTQEERIAKQARMLREHGQEKKYIHLAEGFNYRMDGLQGAALSVKLPRLNGWNERRRKLAEQYGRELASLEIALPVEPPYARSVYHLYVIESDHRNEMREFLSRKEIGTGLHYPIALHLQEAYRSLGYVEGSFPVAERSCNRVLSLPMFPELEDAEQRLVIDAVKEFCGSPVGKSETH